MADKDALIGQQISNYQIVSPIAAGAFGTVYRAQHQYLQERIVAIKVLHMHLGSPEEKAQFLREAQILEHLQHAHILTLLDVGIFNALPYLITTYAAGGSLRYSLNRSSQLIPWEMTRRLLIQIGQALYFAHEQQIVHRDLKPENILLSDKKDALLADFGIASILTKQSVKYTTVTGTPSYMAPEQFRGTVSAQSDQYALGCIAYELVTGRTPFNAPDFIAMGFMHATEPVIPPRQLNASLPEAIEQVILKTLMKDRHARYPNMQEFLNALQTADQSTPLLNTSLPATSQIRPIVPPTIVPGTSQSQASFPYQTPPVSTNDRKDYTDTGDHTLEQWLDKGWNLQRNAKYQEALNAYEQALRLDAKNVDALNGKGRVLRWLERYQEMLAVYERMAQLYPDDTRAFCGKGFALYYMDRNQEALTAFEHSLSLDPNNDLAADGKGHVLMDLKRYEEAINAYELALHLDPMDFHALRGKGKALYWLNRDEQAIVAYDQALQLKPADVQTLLDKGDALCYLDRYQEALHVYEQALSLDGNNARAYQGKGLALSSLERYPEALECLDQAIRIMPDNVRYYVGKGDILTHMDRNQDALMA